MEGESSSPNNSRIVKNEGIGLRIDNPFALKVAQVFTGFGIGCGVGIGVGRPLNLGAIPMLNQVMSATRGATDAFSGVSRHVNSSLRKLGAKNIEVGIGCGVGFGHGFGVGLAVKPGVLHQIQSCLIVAMTKVMMKFGIAPPISIGSMMPLATNSPNQASQGLASSRPIGSAPENIALNSNVVDSNFGSRTEKVLSNFLQSPLLKGEANRHDQLDGRMRSENNILQMILKHQQIIDELVEENEKLRQILVEDLKIPSSKLQASSSRRNKLPCTDCFECRRKQKKR